jgi:hypothetical protein
VSPSGSARSGRALQAALAKLDANDKGRAQMLGRQLQRWIEMAIAPRRPNQHTQADIAEC